MIALANRVQPQGWQLTRMGADPGDVLRVKAATEAATP